MLRARAAGHVGPQLPGAAVRARLRAILETDVPGFNALLERLGPA